MQAAQEKAARIVEEAEAEASLIHSGADKRADKIISEAEQYAAEIKSDAEAKANRILHGAMEEKGLTELPEFSEVLPGAERAQDSEDAAAEPEAAAEAEAPAAQESASAAMSDEMQEYVVRCVGDCFAKLRQRQEESNEFLNEQWRNFLSGLALPDLPNPSRKKETVGQEISRKEIQDRVSAIARELMDIIGE